MKTSLILLGFAWFLCAAAPAAPPDRGVLAGHQDPVTALAFSPDGLRLVSADGSGVIRVWDLATGKPLQNIEAHEGAVHSLAVSRNGKGIVSAGADNAVKVWSLQSGQNIRGFVPEAAELPFEDQILQQRQKVAKGAGAAAFSGDSRFIVSGHYDFNVIVWDLKTGAFKTFASDVQARLEGKAHSEPVSAVAFAADGSLVASGQEASVWKGILATEPETSGLLIVWNPRTGAVVQSITLKAGVVGLAFLPDNKQFATALTTGSVGIYDARKGKMTRSFAHGAGLRAMSLSFDGARLASLSPTTLKVWDLAGGGAKTVKVGADCTSVAIAPDGQRAAVGQESGTIRIVEVGALQQPDLWDDRPATQVEPKNAPPKPKPDDEQIWDDKPAPQK